MKNKIKVLFSISLILSMLVSILWYRNISATTHEELVKDIKELNACITKSFDEVTCTLDSSYPDIAYKDVISVPNDNYASKVTIVGKTDSSGNMVPLKYLNNVSGSNHSPHFEINLNSTKTQLIIDKLYLLGNVETDINGKPLPINKALNIWDYQRGGIKINNSQVRNESFKILNSRFELIKGTPVSVTYSPDSDVYVENSSFINNHNYAAAGIFLENNPKNVTIKNNYFEGNIGNTNTAGGYDGGVIYIKNAIGTVNITNNYFKNNSTYTNTSGTTKMGGGGAIGVRFTYTHNVIHPSVYNIIGNYFEKNEAGSNPDNPNDFESDFGGAISFKGSNGQASNIIAALNIRDNTFNGNISHHLGGAISLMNFTSNAGEIVNNTFYKNEVDSVNGWTYQGAGIYVGAEIKGLNVIGNTFVDNVSKVISGVGCIGVDVTLVVNPINDFRNNLLSGAKAYSGGTLIQPTAQQSVKIAFLRGSNSYNLGSDLLGMAPINRALTFGTETPQLKDNGGFLVGSATYETTIPTIRIGTYVSDGTKLVKGQAYEKIPKVNTYKTTDQRGKNRASITTDHGANEYAPLVYDANGGQWNFSETADFSSAITYFGLTPTQYVVTDNVSATRVLIGGNNLSKGIHIFLGWDANPNATIPSFLPGGLYAFNKENKLYAIWQNLPELSVTYYPNDATSGVVPTDTNLYSLHQNVTVLEKNDLEKHNSAFIGWNTQPDGSGAMYQPGTIFNIKYSMKLYAQFADYGSIYNTLNIRQRTSNTSENIVPNEGYANLETLKYKPKITKIFRDSNSPVTPSLNYFNLSTTGIDYLNLVFNNNGDESFGIYLNLKVTLNDGTIIPDTTISKVHVLANSNTEEIVDLNWHISHNGIAYNIDDINKLEFSYYKTTSRGISTEIPTIYVSDFTVEISKEVNTSQIKYVGYASNDVYYTNINVDKNIYEYKISNIDPMYYMFIGQRISDTEASNNTAPLTQIATLRNLGPLYISMWYTNNKDKEEQYYSWSNETTPIK